MQYATLHHPNLKAADPKDWHPYLWVVRRMNRGSQMENALIGISTRRTSCAESNGVIIMVRFLEAFKKETRDPARVCPSHSSTGTTGWASLSSHHIEMRERESISRP